MITKTPADFVSALSRLDERMLGMLVRHCTRYRDAPVTRLWLVRALLLESGRRSNAALAGRALPLDPLCIPDDEVPAARALAGNYTATMTACARETRGMEWVRAARLFVELTALIHAAIEDDDDIPRVMSMSDEDAATERIPLH